MSFKLNTYFVFVSLAFCVYAFFLDSALAPYFLVANLPLIFFSEFVSRYSAFPQILQVSSYAIWVFNMPRALFLFKNPTFFIYPIAGQINEANHIDTLLTLTLYSTVFLLSFFLFPKNLRVQFDRENFDFFFRKRGIVLWFAVGIMLFNAFLMIVFKVGVHGASTGLEFLKFIMPYKHILPMVLLFVMHYKKKLSSTQFLLISFILLLNVVGSFLQGSKAVLMLVALFAIFILLVCKPKTELKFSKFFIYVFCIGIPLFASFLFMDLLRNFSRLHPEGVDYGKLLNVFWEQTTDKNFATRVGGIFTGRLGCYDGIMVTFLRHSESIDKVFSLGNMFASYIELLVPFVSNDSVALGSGVSQHISNLPSTFKHAGAIGGFGTMLYLGGSWAILLAVAVPAIWSLFLAIVLKTVRSLSLQLVYVSLWFASVFLIINSGNFDSILQSATIDISHLIFYYWVLKLIWASVVDMTEETKVVKVEN